MVKLKPELSKKNKYWVNKNRYYELKFPFRDFCNSFNGMIINNSRERN